MIALQVIFWVLILGIVHSYVLYPILLSIWKRGKKQNMVVYSRNEDELPAIAILMAAHNEEKVIAAKIESVYSGFYPLHKIHFYIGSDNSTDATDSIIESYQNKYPNLELVKYGRSGKPAILNHLEQLTRQEVLILTDANVFFDKDTLYHLVKHFKNEEIALVGANIVNDNLRREGISVQEKYYLDSEKIIKYNQGVVWGTMIGAFGGCFAIRKSAYSPVSKNFVVDDFYLTMNVLRKEKRAINELDALCFEDVSNKIYEEFRRKVRISIGNFQNLIEFRDLLWPPFTGVAFSFFSYKVLRWLTPFFILICLGINLLLVNYSKIYNFILVIQLVSLTLPLLDWVLKKNQINLKLLRFITHFYAMNLALLIGFFRFVTGVKSNVWKPTERNQ